MTKQSNNHVITSHKGRGE